MNQYNIYTNPEKPMKAIAIKPAIIRAIGVPFMPSGMSAVSNCSLIPAKSTNAKAKPIAVDTANTVPSARL